MKPDCKTFKSTFISPSQSPDSAHVNVTSNPSTPDKKDFDEFDQNRRDSGVSDVSSKAAPVVEFRRHSDLPTINTNQQFLNEVRRGSDTNTLSNWKIPGLAMDIKSLAQNASSLIPNNEVLSTTNSKIKDREVIYPVSCGDLQGHLYFTRFLCPGINANCILHEGEWITPKSMVSRAGKTALKDWKRALRINGQMLRKLIDSKELDYYKHDEHCSNSCRSNKGEYLAMPNFKSNSFDTASFYQQQLNKKGIFKSPQKQKWSPRYSNHTCVFAQTRSRIFKSLLVTLWPCIGLLERGLLALAPFER